MTLVWFLRGRGGQYNAAGHQQQQNSFFSSLPNGKKRWICFAAALAAQRNSPLHSNHKTKRKEFYFWFVHCVGAVPAESDGIDWISFVWFWVGYGPESRPMAPPKEANTKRNSIQGWVIEKLIVWMEWEQIKLFISRGASELTPRAASPNNTNKSIEFSWEWNSLICGLFGGGLLHLSSPIHQHFINNSIQFNQRHLIDWWIDWNEVSWLNWKKRESSPYFHSLHFLP